MPNETKSPNPSSSGSQRLQPVKRHHRDDAMEVAADNKKVRIEEVGWDDRVLTREGKVRGKGAMDEGTNLAARAILFWAWSSFCRVIGFAPDTLDPFISAKVGSVFWAGYSLFRKELNGNLKESDKTNAQQMNEVLLGNDVKQMSQHQVMECFKTAYFEVLGSQPVKSLDGELGNKYIGSLTVNVALVTMIKPRLSELLSSNKVSKKGSRNEADGGKVVTVYNTKVNALPPAMRWLAHGLDFPVTMKGSLAQSMGPYVGLQQLATQKDNTYVNKWRESTRRAFAMIPHIDTVIEVFRQQCHSKNANSLWNTVTHLCDIASIVGTREARKAAFPIGFFYYYHRKIVEEEVEENGVKTKKEVVKFDTEKSKLWAFSGAKAMKIYHQYAGLLKNLPITTCHSPDVTAQILFHLIWSSDWEDFGVLSKVTSKNKWDGAEILHKAYAGLDKTFGGTTKQDGSKNEEVYLRIISLPYFNYWSKLISATNVNMIEAVQKYKGSGMVFAGKRKRLITDEMVDALNPSNITAPAIGTSLMEVEAYLSEIKLKLLKKMSAMTSTGGARLIDAGVVPWMKASTVDDANPEYTDLVCDEIGMNAHTKRDPM